MAKASVCINAIYRLAPSLINTVKEHHSNLVKMDIRRHQTSSSLVSTSPSVPLGSSPRNGLPTRRTNAVGSEMWIPRPFPITPSPAIRRAPPLRNIQGSLFQPMENAFLRVGTSTTRPHVLSSLHVSAATTSSEQPPPLYFIDPHHSLHPTSVAPELVGRLLPRLAANHEAPVGRITNQHPPHPILTNSTRMYPEGYEQGALSTNTESSARILDALPSEQGWRPPTGTPPFASSPTAGPALHVIVCPPTPDRTCLPIAITDAESISRHGLISTSAYDMHQSLNTAPMDETSCYSDSGSTTSCPVTPSSSDRHNLPPSQTQLRGACRRKRGKHGCQTCRTRKKV